MEHLSENTNSKTENNVNLDPRRSECGHQSPAYECATVNTVIILRIAHKSEKADRILDFSEMTNFQSYIL